MSAWLGCASVLVVTAEMGPHGGEKGVHECMAGVGDSVLVVTAGLGPHGGEKGVHESMAAESGVQQSRNTADSGDAETAHTTHKRVSVTPGLSLTPRHLQWLCQAHVAKIITTHSMPLRTNRVVDRQYPKQRYNL